MPRVANIAMICALILLGFASTGCVSLFSDETWDERNITLLYASLFNQRNPGEVYKSWAGDWLFRRERLLVIDQMLSDRKPDVVIFQQSMMRQNSESESDVKILSSGALEGYEWDLVEVEQYQDSNEIENHAVAVGLPLRPVRLPPKIKRLWRLDKDHGKVSFFIVELGKHQIPIFNIEVDKKDNLDHTMYFKQLKNIINDTIEQDHLCRKRVVVAGKMPANFTSLALADFLEDMQLRDISEGFCEIPSDCYTGVPRNDIFVKTSPSQTGSQLDRVLVHRSAYVNSTNVVLNQSVESNMFEDIYQQPKLWPVERFGWSTTLRLSQCDD